MRLYSPLLCAKCQGNRIKRSRFIAVFVSEEKKTKKLRQFLKSHISGTFEAISLKFGMWSTAVGGSVHRKKIVLFHQGSTELRRCENCVFFLPVNILKGVAHRLLGPHDTLPCVLISNQKQPNCKKRCGPQKCHGEKRCEIQGGGQEMAVMVG